MLFTFIPLSLIFHALSLLISGFKNFCKLRNTPGSGVINVREPTSLESSKLLLSTLMIVVFFFSALSISEIFEDYVHDEKIKNICIKLLYASAIIIPFLTTVVIYNLNI